MKKVIYCFSGTGNSLNAARIIAKEMGGATIVSVKKGAKSDLAAEADVVGFVCPVYEWDIPETQKDFAENLAVNPKAYTFLVATYVAIHGRCFETMDAILRKKGTRLHFGKPLRCVASQCIAYEPFPSPKLMVPYSDRCARKIGRQIAERKTNNYPRMSPITRARYDKAMMPFLNIQHEYDTGFYTSDACVGCGLCEKICPCKSPARTLSGITAASAATPAWCTAPKRPSSTKPRRPMPSWITSSPGGWVCPKSAPVTTIPMLRQRISSVKRKKSQWNKRKAPHWGAFCICVVRILFSICKQKDRLRSRSFFVGRYYNNAALILPALYSLNDQL